MIRWERRCLHIVLSSLSPRWQPFRGVENLRGQKAKWFTGHSHDGEGHDGEDHDGEKDHDGESDHGDWVRKIGRLDTLGALGQNRKA